MSAKNCFKDKRLGGRVHDRSHPGQRRASIRKRAKQARTRKLANNLGFSSVFEMMVEQNRRASQQRVVPKRGWWE